MIKNIVDIFYKVSQAHKDVKTFVYDIPSKYVGNGETKYPLLLLEEPIRLEPNKGVLNATINIQVTTNETEDKVFNQAKCEKIAKDILAYLDKYANDYITVQSYDILSLCRYNDDDADGVSLTVNVSANNDFNYCVEDAFDPEKRFDTDKELPSISTEEATGCNTEFQFKLPNF